MTKRFKFSLASVLKLRRHETEQARQAFAQAAAAVQRQRERVGEARRRLDRLAEQAGTAGASDPSVLRQRDAFRQEAQHAYSEARRQLEALRDREAEARNRLLERQRAEETLQTLHDQQRAGFLEQQAKAEMNFLDEQALSGFHRKK